MNATPLLHSQLGFRPDSPKRLSLTAPKSMEAQVPERVRFYVRPLFGRIPREHAVPEFWSGRYFRWPFDLASGKLKPSEGRVVWQGELVKRETRWGAVWQGDFSGFRETGNFQIESDYGCTFPITIRPDVYDRVQRGYLNYLHCQRSGFEIPGIRPAEHLDDGVLDTTGEQISAAGGWYDAGDLRKWMFLTQPNLWTLAELATRGHPGLRAAAVDEIRWGNKFFHGMMAPDGMVWEDLAGGTFKRGLDPEKDWWYENHPGCNCDNSGGRFTDNQPNSGDERLIRTQYNPAVQFMFVRAQCRIASVLPESEKRRCLKLATKAWAYGRLRGHDRRTLFVAEELWAAVELQASGAAPVTDDVIRTLLDELLQRQDAGGEGLQGYFMEKGGTDGFRCIALACEPVMALLRLVELSPPSLARECKRAKVAVARYVDGFVLADAESNPFSVGPYGVYFNPPMADKQLFRDAGRNRRVRTFIHPFGPQEIVHGTGAVILHQAVACAKGGVLLGRPEWQRAAEVMLQWTFGHNPQGLSLHAGIGYRHPTPFSAYVTQLPDTVVVGHIGRPDDTPYLETSPLIEWCTQEVWDIPNLYLTEAVLWL